MGGKKITRREFIYVGMFAAGGAFAGCGDSEAEKTRIPDTSIPEGSDVASIPQATDAGISDEPRRGGELIITASVSAPRHFNPALISGSSVAIIGAQIFASPLSYDENWKPQPYLAERWDVSENGLAITLHLVEGAVFHDNSPITSEDVAFSVMTVKEYHPFNTMFAPVETVDTPDPQTAVIRLSRPHPAILLAMSPALLPILPKHIFGDGQDLSTHPANLNPIGSGPFCFVEKVDESRVLLRRNDHYFVPGRPYLDRIIFQLDRSSDSQVIDMQRQEAHMMPYTTKSEDIDRLNKIEHLTVTNRGFEGLGPINWLAFNLLRKPLDDKRVRKAIAYAIDPDFIISYLHRGWAQRATGPIAPDSPFYEANVHMYDLDLDKAKRLLDDAGYPVQASGKRFSLILDYIPIIPLQQRDIALYLKRQLSLIEIDITVRTSANMLDWSRRIGDWDFDMTLDVVYNWSDPVIGVHRTYRSDNIRQGVVWSNTQNYRNPRVDELLCQAEQELDREKRKALYSEFQQIVTDELPVAWINIIPFHVVYHSLLGNPPLSIWGIHSPFDNLYWRAPLVREYAPRPSLEGSDSLALVGKQAIILLQEMGLYDALQVFQDPEQGFLDLEQSGLHVIGFTRAGIVFLDNSGQMQSGMDISSILDLAGNKLVPQFVTAAQDEGYVYLDGSWPHPVTQVFSPASVWCGMLSEEDVVCAMKWD